jgi:hypothetical protein
MKSMVWMLFFASAVSTHCSHGLRTSMSGVKNHASPNTKISLVRPALYDSETCDQTVFSGELQTLIPGSPQVLGISTRHDLDPVTNRDTLVIEYNIGGQQFRLLSIEGSTSVTSEIEYALAQGNELKLTESKKCAEGDPTLKLIDTANIRTEFQVFSINLDSKMEVIRKDEQGVCAVKFSKSIKDVILEADPSAALSSIATRVFIYTDGVLADGTLATKRVDIMFHNKETPVSSPIATIKISVPPILTYAIIDQLSQPQGGTLRMTMIRDCFGERFDSPVRVTNLSIE